VVVSKLGFGQPLVSLFQSFASPTANFLAAFGFGLLGTLFFALFGKDLGRSEPAITGERKATS
jgi:hypothetical protein